MTGIRAASELLFLFGVLSMLPVGLSAELIAGPLAVGSLACALAGWLREKPAMRYGCTILPPLSLLMASTREQMLLMALPIFYSEMLICTDRLFTTYWGYSRHIRFSLLIASLCVVLSGLLGARGILPAVCFLGYLVTGVFFLRQLRLGSGVSLRGKLRDLGAVIAVPGIVGLTGALLTGGKPLLVRIAALFASLFAYLFQAFIALLVMITPSQMPPPETKPTEPTLPAESLPVEIIPPETVAPGAEPFEIPGVIYKALVLVTLGVLAAAVITALVRFLRRPAQTQAEGTWVEESQSVSHPPETARQMGSNRRKIRRIYGKYLALMRSRGYRQHRRDTSRDVLEATLGFSLDEDCAELRWLYIRARYAMDETITASDVQNAKQLLHRIKEGLIRKADG